MADTPEQEIVSAISAAGWLQGDTVSGDALIEHISEEVLKGQFEGGGSSLLDVGLPFLHGACTQPL